MKTKEDLYTKYGQNIVFLFKSEEPYYEENGIALGVLLEKDDKVLCNICDGWFPALAPHLKIHDTNVKEYKENFGFNRATALCSRKTSQKLRDAWAAAPNRRTHAKRQAKRLVANRKPTQGNFGGGTRMQNKNYYNTCPEQLKQRWLMIASKYGENVGLRTIRKIDPGLETRVRKDYGTWNNFRETLGLEVSTFRLNAANRIKADLIYSMREYVQKYGELPFENNYFRHGRAEYLEAWGSMRRALLACGVWRPTKRRGGEDKQTNWELVS